MDNLWRRLRRAFPSLSKNLSVTVVAVQLLALLIVVLPASSQDTASRIRSEIDQIQQAAAKKPDSDPEWKDAKHDIESSLARARADLDAGRIYSSLEELRAARGNFLAMENYKSHSGVDPKDSARFQAEWQTAGLELAEFNRKAQERVWTNAPAAIRALSEAAQGQTIVVLQAGRAYSAVTNPEYGFANLGEAKAIAEFSNLCYSLNLSRHGAPFPARSVLPELQRLQERTVAAFKPPRSIEQHPNFIRLNGTLKLAAELDAAGLHAGALYEYLNAVRQFGAFDAIAPDAAKQSPLRQTLTAIDARLRTSSRDDSIAQIFVERAQALIAGNGSAPSPDDWKKVGIIVDQVLPAYFTVLDTAAPQQQKASGTITVTLVRWPYT